MRWGQGGEPGSVPLFNPAEVGGKPPTGPEWTQSDAERAGVLGVV